MRYDPEVKRLALVETAALPRGGPQDPNVDNWEIGSPKFKAANFDFILFYQRLNRHSGYNPSFSDFIPESEELELFMDVATAYQLLD